MSMGSPLSRRRARPRFKPGTTMQERVEDLLIEMGIVFVSVSVKRFGNRGGVYIIFSGDRAIGEYYSLYHKIHLYQVIDE